MNAQISGQKRPQFQDAFDHDKGQKSAISGRRLHWIFCFFSSFYVQYSKTSPLKSGESSEKSSGENRVKSCHVCGCHGFFGPDNSPPRKECEKNRPKVPFSDFLGSFLTFWGIFGGCWQTPKKTLFETFVAILGAEGPEIPVNGGIGLHSQEHLDSGSQIALHPLMPKHPITIASSSVGRTPRGSCNRTLL